MLVDNGKEKLIKVIGDYVTEVSDNKEMISEIKEELNKYRITGGRVENILSDVNVLEDADLREVTLLAEQFYDKTRIEALNPKEWFTELELKDARQFDKSIYTEEETNSQIVFENTVVVGNGVYATVIEPSMIEELMKTQVLYYDFDIQRQPKMRKNEMPKPTVYRKNVKEITSLLLKGQLISTTLAFNATIGSSDSDEELSFNAETGALIVNSGTRLAILDGYHRCLASVDTIKQNPDIKFNFMLMISNYTTKEAQQYQAQLAKATPIPKTRVQELEANRLADAVVQQLRAESELKDKISSYHSPNRVAGELVSYNVISDAIDREFPMKVRRDTTKVAEFLTKFFDYLIGDNQEEFLYNSEDQKSLMNYNKMFSGYIALAARMQKENIAMDELQDILDKIDFSRDNKLWVEIGILDSEGKIKSKSDERKIANYFKALEI